jgi:hypothetical protein
VSIRSCPGGARSGGVDEDSDVAQHGLLDRIAIVGGADPRDPALPEDRVRPLGVGFLVLTIAVWAFIGGTHLGTASFHLKLPWACIPGLILGSVVGLIDMLITVSFLESRSVATRLNLIGVRGLLSLGMGLVLGYLSLLMIYGSTIDQLVGDTNRAKALSIEQEFRTTSALTGHIGAARAAIGKDQEALAQDGRTRLVADQALVKAQDAVAAARQAWLDDTIACKPGSSYACNGDRAGSGAVSTPLKAAYRRAVRQDLPLAQQMNKSSLAAVAADQAAKQKDVLAKQTQIDAWNHELDRKATAVVGATLADTGTQAQNVALRHILAHDLLAWIWPLFFLLIDLVIAMLKGILPESDYDRRRRRERALDDAVHADLDAAPAFADLREHAAARKAEVFRARVDAAADRELDRLRASNRRPWPEGVA